MCSYPATAAAVADPAKNFEARAVGLLYMSQKPCRFSSLVKCFLTTLGCSDYVYKEISIVPSKHISNLMLKFLLEIKLISLKLGVFRL